MATKATKKILVAEDDRFYANIYQTKLAKEGYDVLMASNGQEAIERAVEGHPDLILLDLIMPVKDGFQVLREVREMAALKSTPVIVLSNLGQDEDIEKAKQLGATEYLVKANISLQHMLDKVKAYLK